MGFWEDTFGEGSRFGRVYYRAPILSVAVLALLLGMVGGPLGIIYAMMLGTFCMLFNYMLATVPGAVAWFLAFRLARLAGLCRIDAAMLAAPVMAFVASVVLAYGLEQGWILSHAFGPFEFWRTLWVVTPFSMVVSLFVAVTGSEGGAGPRVQWQGKDDIPHEREWS